MIYVLRWEIIYVVYTYNYISHHLFQVSRLRDDLERWRKYVRVHPANCFMAHIWDDMPCRLSQPFLKRWGGMRLGVHQVETSGIIPYAGVRVGQSWWMTRLTQWQGKQIMFMFFIRVTAATSVADSWSSVANSDRRTSLPILRTNRWTKLYLVMYFSLLHFL